MAKDERCPNCGYCPTCGRANPPARVIYPPYPYPYPWWQVTYKYGEPYTTTTGSTVTSSLEAVN